MFLNTVFKENVVRNSHFDVLGIIDSKTDQKMLTFLENEKYLEKMLSRKNITCVITTQELAKIILEKTELGVYVSERPRIDFFKLHNFLSDDNEYNRSKSMLKIGDNCKISKMSCISEKNVTIGNNVVIEEFVSIKDNVKIGDNCVIRAGSVIGGTGFEFKKDKSETFAVKHCGGVVIQDNVEIQYNCCIDKALFPWDDTVIGEYTKFDNLVHIGHAVKIGKNVLFPAGTTVSGRVEISDGVWIGVGSVLSNGISFGKNSRCNIGSVVTKDVLENASVTGNFAINHDKFIENLKKTR